MSPPGAISPIREKFRGKGGGKIPPVAKSRGPHTNALAYMYAKHALLT